MEAAVTIGVDLGRSVFQVHGVDREGIVVVQRRLTRARLLAFFAKRPAAWLAWRPARPNARYLPSRLQEFAGHTTRESDLRIVIEVSEHPSLT
jgi:transposase